MSRSIRVTGKTHIRAEKGRRRHGNSFFAGLLAGLSSATVVHEHVKRPRSYTGGGLRADWRAVGDDIRSATQKYVDEAE